MIRIYRPFFIIRFQFLFLFLCSLFSETLFFVLLLFSERKFSCIKKAVLICPSETKKNLWFVVFCNYQSYLTTSRIVSHRYSFFYSCKIYL